MGKMDRIKLNEQFYEDEVREGFYVPACVKQAWGAQIRVLNDVDRVCSELGIKYFADWGTFLGAVRHGGFVPWDDDFDICMLRDDYNRFLAEGVSRLPEGYAVFNLETREDREQFIANVVSKTRICFEPDHLERFHGFPYISAMDIFLIDYMSNDEAKQEKMKAKAKYILSISDGIRTGRLRGDELRSSLVELEKLLGICIPTDLAPQKIRQKLDIEAEKLFASFVDEKDKADRIVQMMPWGLKDSKIMPHLYYSQTVDIPFETGTIPVPVIYDEALRVHYGDYMQLYKNAGGHDYPFFLKSRAQLQEVLDFDLPEYRIDPSKLIERPEKSEETITYRETVNECMEQMLVLCEDLHVRIMQDMSEDDAVKVNTCADIQQLAIDLGTYMEAVKGEGYDIVGKLETFCEELYELTQIITDDNDAHSSTVGEKYDKIRNILEDIKNETGRRREILFLPFKDKYWKTMEPVYDLVKDDEDVDVYVLPIPYYYKDYRGQLNNMQYLTDGYPPDVRLTHYDEYDYAIHHPDIIVIQNPYDNYNDEMSVPPFFYSDKLLGYTDDLVYIPWFETYDFTRENKREFINMNWYCTMPGVINADTIVLGTDTMRNTYVEKLCDFAGEDTRDLWETKIVTYGSEEMYSLLKIKKETSKTGEEQMVVTDDGDPTQKILLYYPDFSDILQRGQQAVDKIKSVLDIFADNNDSLRYMILNGRLIEDKLKIYDRSLYDMYMKTVNDAVAGANGAIALVNEREADYDALVADCSAYYGDAGHLAHMFRNAGKPVMIQNYEIR